MDFVLMPTLYDYSLSDSLDESSFVTKETIEKLFTYFKNLPLFNWQNSNNGCEARADAICVLLDAWHIPNYKAWVFSGYYLKKHIGGLNQQWNYHVAALLQAKEDNKIVMYVIDPTSSDGLQTIEDWAASITQFPHSYHFVKNADYYIFNDRKITKSNWYKRNKQNRKWMIQGIAGINSISIRGKAKLCFRKETIKQKAIEFEILKRNYPFV